MNGDVEGLYVGFRITRWDLFDVGLLIGCGAAVGAVAAVGIMDILSKAIRFALQWVLHRFRKDEDELEF